MGLYKREKIYFWNFYFEGKKYFRSTRTCNKKLAQKIFEHERDKIINQSRFGISEEKKLLSEMIDEYISLRKTTKSKSRDLLSVRTLLKFFDKNMRLIEITSKKIEQYIVKRQSDGIANSTINRELACLRHMLNKAIEWDYLKLNPFRKIKLLKENNKRDRILDQKEIKRLIDSADGNLKNMIILALNTGMRRSEIFNLKWCDIDLKNKLIHLPITKSGKKQEIPINNNLVKLILDLPHLSEYVFTSFTGTRYFDVKSMWKKTIIRANIKNFRFHDLRHQFASYLAMSGVDLTTIQKLMRHSNINLTMRYSHLLDNHLRDAVAELNYY